MAPVTAAVPVVTQIVLAARIRQVRVPAVADVLLVPEAAVAEEAVVAARTMAIELNTAIAADTPARPKRKLSIWMIRI